MVALASPNGTTLENVKKIMDYVELINTPQNWKFKDSPINHIHPYTMIYDGCLNLSSAMDWISIINK